MELTTLDRELLDGLRVLTDEEVGRVQAHLAAGLPMILNWGWTGDDPAVCGCLVGVAMGKNEALNGPRTLQLVELTSYGFIRLVHDTDDRSSFGPDHLERPVSRAVKARLSALLDMEWNRRHPVTVEDKPALINRAQEYKPELIQEAVSVG